MGRIACTFHLTAFLAISIVAVVSAERILFLLPLASRSHKIFFEPLINTLAKRGHQVTVLTNEKTTHGWHNPLNDTGVEELVPLSSYELMKNYPDPFDMRRSGKSNMAFPFQFVISGCHKVIQSEIFQNVFMTNSPQKKFDLIVVDSFLSNCFDGFIYKSGIQFILVTTMPAPSYIMERLGGFLPPSIIPVMSFRGYSESDGEMSFSARLRNFCHFIIARLYVNFVILPSLEKVYRDYLGDDLPGIMQIEEGAKMLFMNSHYSMNFPRPLLPAVVEIGGIHCRKSKSLTNHGLAKFISKSSSPNGFIYFSIGSMIKISEAPEDFISTLFAAFSNLEQRVVIKWKKGLMKNSSMNGSTFEIPANVWIDDWFSQQDLLGHDNIRLFISHGGLLSMQEAVYHGVPVLGIPFGADQDTNIHNAVLQGYALKLDISQLNEKILTTSIHQILNDTSFSRNVQKISKAFRQRQSTPLDTAVFWTEYVLSTIKDNSTEFIRSPARKMSIFQYYSCDIFLFLMTAFVLAAHSIRLIARKTLILVKILVIMIKRRIHVINYAKLHRKIH